MAIKYEKKKKKRLKHQNGIIVVLDEAKELDSPIMYKKKT